MQWIMPTFKKTPPIYRLMHKKWPIILTTALGGFFSANCNDTPKPLCDYDAAVQETPEERVKRLGNPGKSCMEIIPGHNTQLEDRINIVYVGVNYPKQEFYVGQVKKSVDCSLTDGGILSREPFASNMHSFNFWYVSSMAYVDNYQEGLLARAEESIEAVEQLATQCNVRNRAIIAQVNWDFRPNAYFTSSLRGLRLYEMNLEPLQEYKTKYPSLSVDFCREALNDCEGSEYHKDICEMVDDLRGNQDLARDPNICKLLAGGNLQLGLVLLPPDYHFATPHELGHAIAQLRDEYADDAIMADYSGPELEELLEGLRMDGINCFVAQTQQECEQNAPWGYLEDGLSGCYQGCNYTSQILGTPLWRSYPNSIMWDGDADNFGPWNLRQWCDVFFAVTGKQQGICQQMDNAPPHAPQNIDMSSSFCGGSYKR